MPEPLLRTGLFAQQHGPGTSIGVHVDTNHVNIDEDGFVAAVEQAGERLGSVHIGESHRDDLARHARAFIAERLHRP